jgi:hypothetical protein
MFANVNDLIASLTSLGGEAAAADHDRFAGDLAALLAIPPVEIVDVGAYRAALAHGFAYYFWRWDRRAMQLLAAVQNAVITWSAAPVLDPDLLCELVDFHYFVVWCHAESSTQQCARGRLGMEAAVAGFARLGRPAPAMPAGEGPVHVLWLAMFASTNDPMTSALRHVAPALMAQPDRFRLTVMAWRFAEPEFIAWLRGLGVVCHTPRAPSLSALIGEIEALAAADQPAIAVSDMNNAVPTALFTRRLAPAQIFLQAGMPHWPVRPLDAVFNSFGFDPVAAGWGAARMLEFNPPWDLAQLNPPEQPVEMAEQRAGLPQGVRLIGIYGRLVKLTEPCLLAAEQILLRCPDVAFVTGGTGDAGPIRDFIAKSPVGDRMQVVEGFVPGHSWGRLLDVFLDSWPVTGGESCREMLAKGRPVVTMHSAEMPAIDQQRDPALVARNWQDYADMTVRLLQDPVAYEAACERASAVARAYADPAKFQTRLAHDLNAVLADRRRLGPSGLRAWVQRWLKMDDAKT